MLCPYCLEREADTQDHVVPEGLFVVSPPGGYIKIPAGKTCNNGHSRDEEYSLVTVLGEATLTSAAANRVLDRLGEDHRTGKRRRIGLAKSLRAKTTPAEIYTPAGIFVAKGGAIELDTSRINRVLVKMFRGLYFHEFGAPLPKDAVVFVEIKPEADHIQWPPVQAALGAPPKALADVFSYRLWTLAGHPTHTSWALGFYDAVLAIAITGLPPLREATLALKSSA